jgi:hypothetical protein
MSKSSRAADAAPAGRLARLVRPWVDFWFTPVDAVGLRGLRILSGLLILTWLLTFAGHYQALFGLGGWFDATAYREASRLPDGAPMPLSWSVLYLCGTNATLLTIAYWMSLGVVALFSAGIWPRLTAVLTWVVAVSFSANPALNHYGADDLLVVLAFYLMVGHLLQGQWSARLSLAGRLLGSRRPAPVPSHAANLAVRLLQVHFAVAVVISGLHKLQFADWWSGAAFWYPLNPPLDLTAEKLRAQSGSATSLLFFLSLAQYATLAWQIGFPLFAWRQRWRPVLLGGALLGWAGSVFLFAQPVFGPVLVVACLSYLSPAEWQRLGSALRKGARALLSRRPAAARPAEAVRV